MATDDIHTCISTAIPKALADLIQSHTNIDQIAQYCKNAYAVNESEQDAVFQKTQGEKICFSSLRAYRSQPTCAMRCPTWLTTSTLLAST